MLTKWIIYLKFKSYHVHVFLYLTVLKLNSPFIFLVIFFQQKSKCTSSKCPHKIGYICKGNWRRIFFNACCLRICSLVKHLAWGLWQVFPFQLATDDFRSLWSAQSPANKWSHEVKFVSLHPYCLILKTIHHLVHLKRKTFYQQNTIITNFNYFINRHV